MKIIRIFAFLMAITTLFATHQAMAAHEGLDIRILEAKRILSKMTEGTNPAIPQDVIQRAESIIIFPRMAKVGFFYAGRFGVGVALSRDAQTRKWSAPAFIRVAGGSFGLQFGAQKSEMILVGRDGYRLERLGNGGPTVSGSVSATAAYWGYHNEMGTGWQFNTQMHHYSRNSGLFAALAADGTMIKWDEAGNQYYYGANVLAKNVLFEGKIKPSATGQMLIDQLAKIENKVSIPKIILETPTQQDGTAYRYDQPTQPATNADSYQAQRGFNQIAPQQSALPQPAPQQPAIQIPNQVNGQRYYDVATNTPTYSTYYDKATNQTYLTRTPDYYNSAQSTSYKR
ncbi:MAG: lipid-binding SYLF domain-containing protein [Candidatus Omnitrophota bacterium]|jgi:lipid-binding SYLF domain-containing protein